MSCGGGWQGGTWQPNWPPVTGRGSAPSPWWWLPPWCVYCQSSGRGPPKLIKADIVWAALSILFRWPVCPLKDPDCVDELLWDKEIGFMQTCFNFWVISASHLAWLQMSDTLYINAFQPLFFFGLTCPHSQTGFSLLLLFAGCFEFT